MSGDHEPPRRIRPVLRRVRRPVHAGVAHRRDRRARGRLRVREGRSRVPGRAGRAAPHLHRPPVDHHRGAALRRARRRRAHHPEARGPQPHRLAQDQQRARPGAADEAHRQEARDRRDRRRPARRRHGHGGRAVRPRVHDLHGRGRHRSARRSTSRACACSAPRSSRSRPDPARSRTRSTRPTASGSRASRPPTTSSARPPGRIRSRRWCATSRRSSARRRASRCSSSPARLPDAVAACVGGGSNAIGIFHAFLDDADVKLYGFEAAGDGIDTEQARGVDRARPPRHPARRPQLPAAGRGRSDHRVALDLGRASTIRASGPSTRTSPTSAARPTCRRPTPRRWRRCACSAAPRASSRPSSPRTRWPAR